MIAALREKARTLGFLEVRVAEPASLSDWQAAAAVRNDPALCKLSGDPRALLPGARAVLMMAFPYAPYDATPEAPTLDAYYPASDTAYRQARVLAAWLEARGFQALASPMLPLKPLARRAGLGVYGENGLILSPRWGSRMVIEAILTDAPLEPDVGESAEGDCLRCGRCVRLCPAQALRGNGRLDVTRCLRALAAQPQMPEWAMPMLGNSLWGCDICQRACPRNACVASVPMPETLRRAIALDRLLAGDYRDLIPWIGKNYARKARFQARAALAAANLRKAEFLPLLRDLEHSDVPLVQCSARWAMTELTGR